MANGSPGPLVPQIDVLINGAPASAATLGYIEEVAVDDSVELPSAFHFSVTSSDAQDENDPWVDNENLFSVGNTVEIKMGESGAMTSLIVGEITSLEPEFSMGRLPLLNVRGYDRRHRLQRGRKTRTFLQQMDSDIAARVGGEAGLTVQATATGVSLDYVLQAGQTDWEFLCARARLIGYEVIVNDKTLIFRPVGSVQSEALTLSMNDDLVEFYPRLSSVGQVTEVKVQSWSVKDKNAVLGDSKVGDEQAMGGSSGASAAAKAFGSAIDVVLDRPAEAQAEADQIAKARFSELALDFITGEGVCRGRTDLRAGKVVRIEGIGRRFSGPYYVTSAVHRCSSAGGYVTEFAVRRNAS